MSEDRKQYCIDPVTNEKKEIKVRSIKPKTPNINEKTGLLKAPRPEAPTQKAGMGSKQPEGGKS